MDEWTRDTLESLRHLSLGASLGASVAGTAVIGAQLYRQVIGPPEEGFHIQQSVGVPAFPAELPDHAPWPEVIPVAVTTSLCAWAYWKLRSG